MRRAEQPLVAPRRDGSRPARGPGTVTGRVELGEPAPDQACLGTVGYDEGQRLLVAAPGLVGAARPTVEVRAGRRQDVVAAQCRPVAAFQRLELGQPGVVPVAEPDR